MANEIQIGDWSFFPDTATLQKGDMRRRLESRAAEVLALLCRKQGEPVSHAELVAAVWQGRELSRNSVSVVIGDLRRAFEDEARAPRYIETIPKRGYRVVAPVTLVGDAATAPAAPDVRGRWMSARRAMVLTAIAVAVLGLGLAGFQIASASRPSSVVIATAVNETQLPQYDALSATMTQVVATEVARHWNLRVLANGAQEDAQVRIRATVALWEGDPAVYLFADDVRTGEVIWSGVASGPEGYLPRQVREQINEFARTFERDGNGVAQARNTPSES